MEDSGISDKKLLVARGNEKCRKIYRRMRFVSENEE